MTGQKIGYIGVSSSMCLIKIIHGKNTKGGEVIAHCVKKTERIFKEEGLKWPPKKK